MTANPAVQGAETKVAMRHERAHAEFFRAGECLAVIVLGLLGHGGGACPGLAGYAKRPRVESEEFLLATISQSMCAMTAAWSAVLTRRCAMPSQRSRTMYRFSPRLADLGEARCSRLDSAADYSPLNGLAWHRLQPERLARQVGIS